MSGATNVIIDGRAGGVGVSQLTIANTSTTGVVVRFINGALSNTIQFATLAGVNTSTTGGVVLFSTSAGVTGNNKNTIDSCDVRDGATTPVNGIASIGTASTNLLNTGNTISNSNIFNFFSATTATRGITVTVNTNLSNTGWTISNNRLFQTAARNYTTTNTHIAIFVSGGNDYNISGNVVGFSSAAGTGTYTMTSTAVATAFTGIQVQPGSGTNSIQGNTVAGISLGTTTGTLAGMSVPIGSADIGTITGNTIGSPTGNDSLAATSTTNGAFILGLNVSGTAGGNYNVANNTIGSLTATGSPATINPNVNVVQILGGLVTFTNNLLGSTSTANSIQTTTAGTAGTAQQLIGMLTGTTMPLTISGNTVANLTNAGTGTVHVIRAIQFQSPGISSSASAGKPSIVSNIVHDITSSNANASPGATNGILITTGSGGAPSGALIDQNTVFADQGDQCGGGRDRPGRHRPHRVQHGRRYHWRCGEPEQGLRHSKRFDHGGGDDPADCSWDLGADRDDLWTGGEQHGLPRGLANHQHGVHRSLEQLFRGCNAPILVQLGADRGNGRRRRNAELWLPARRQQRHLGGHRARRHQEQHLQQHADRRHGQALRHRQREHGPGDGLGAGASDFNVLNSPVAGTVGIWGLATDEDFGNWKTASACDASSLSGTAVTFVAPATADLHLNMGLTPTPLESGGTVLAVTTDFDNQTRPGPPGSVNGGATAPDIGADEFDGVPQDITAPSITYTAFSNTTLTLNRTLSATITDSNGVAGGVVAPRIYYRKNAGSYVSTQCGAPAGSVYPCTIDYTLVGGVVTGDVIDYFVVAQDTTGNVGANPSGGFSATDVNTVITPPTVPSTYTIIPGTSGTKTVCASGCDFATLTGAGGVFAA